MQRYEKETRKKELEVKKKFHYMILKKKSIKFAEKRD